MWQEQLVTLADSLANTEYGDAESVASHNRSADRIRNLVQEVAGRGAQQLDDLLELLSNENAKGWIAFTLLESTELPDVARNRCITVIQMIAQGSGVDALGARTWLSENVPST